MITISDNLANATGAESRTPVVSVALENYGIDEPTVLVADSSLPYRIRRFQQGDGFYIATAYDVYTNTIYYKRFTSIESSGNWTSGWSSLTTATANGAMCHDMFISGDRVMIAYERYSADIYIRESTDGGQSFGSAYEVYDYSSLYDNAQWISIVDATTIFIAGEIYNTYPGAPWLSVYDFQINRLHRQTEGSTTWLPTSTWNAGSGQIGKGIDADPEYFNINTRSIGDKERTIAVLSKGQWGFSDTQFVWSFIVDYKHRWWSVVDSAFGGYSLDSSNYEWRHHGLSRLFNGYYFTFTREYYPYAADVEGVSLISPDHIARSEDLKSFHMIPFPDRGNSSFVPYMCGVGLSESGDYICIVSGDWGSNGIVYLLNKSTWFGESVSSTDITPYVIETIGINKQLSKASTATMQVSCRTSTFEGNDLTQPNALIRVNAGYDTVSGAETTERFAGYVTSYSRTVGPDAVLSLNMMDRLALGTARSERLPHILKGQNVFFTNFADPLDIDMFVAQVGEWEISPIGKIRNIGSGDSGVNVIFAGFDPTDAAIIQASFRVSSVPSWLHLGLVFNSAKWTAPYGQEENYHKAFTWTPYPPYFEYEEIGTSEFGIERFIHENGSGTLSCSPSTDYCLRAKIKHGRMDGWYSTDGITWTLAIEDVDIGYSTNYSMPISVNSSGYLGLYSYVGDPDLGQAPAPQVHFDSISISSMYPSITGSAAMKYLAGIIGLSYSEEMEIDDDFTGTNFSSRWDTPGVDGTWSVSGGYASGYRSSTDYALIASDIEAKDIVINAVVAVDAYSSGIFVRGSSNLLDCYAFLISGDVAAIAKKESGSWALLQVVPHQYVDDSAKLTLVARGNFISGYINDELSVFAYDTSHTDGTCGLVSDKTSGNPALFDSFSVDAFYIPLDVVTVRPGDKVASVMDQIVGMYDDGYYFVDENENLSCGKLDTTATDIDSRSRIVTLNISKDFNEILTFARVVGENSYGEAFDVDWGRALSGHKYISAEDKNVSTRFACIDAAGEILDESQKITVNSIAIPGHPALEPGDIIKISESPGDAGTNHAVISFSESIGDIYDTTISELRTMTPEDPT